jgi:hypothetical protein
LNTGTGTVFAGAFLIRPSFSPIGILLSKIEFEPRHIFNVTLPEDDNDHIVCFITFNTNAKSLAALSGPDGEEFVKAAREVLKIDPQEEESFMSYRCSPGK